MKSDKIKNWDKLDQKIAPVLAELFNNLHKYVSDPVELTYLMCVINAEAGAYHADIQAAVHVRKNDLKAIDKDTKNQFYKDVMESHLSIMQDYCLNEEIMKETLGTKCPCCENDCE